MNFTAVITVNIGNQLAAQINSGIVIINIKRSFLSLAHIFCKRFGKQCRTQSNIKLCPVGNFYIAYGSDFRRRTADIYCSAGNVYVAACRFAVLALIITASYYWRIFKRDCAAADIYITGFAVMEYCGTVFQRKLSAANVQISGIFTSQRTFIHLKRTAGNGHGSTFLGIVSVWHSRIGTDVGIIHFKCSARNIKLAAVISIAIYKDFAGIQLYRATADICFFSVQRWAPSGSILLF